MHRGSSIRTVEELIVFVEDIATAGQTSDGCRRLSSSVRPSIVRAMVISRKLRKTGQELLWDTIGKLALLILATVLRQG